MTFTRWNSAAISAAAPYIDAPPCGCRLPVTAEQTFEDFYDSRGIAYEDTEFDGRSDYQAFADAGIPSGGLFSGAEGIKTPEQAAAYGGTAGQPYDACYHQACDDLDNISQVALDQNSDAVAYAVLVNWTPDGPNDPHRDAVLAGMREVGAHLRADV